MKPCWIFTPLEQCNIIFSLNFQRFAKFHYRTSQFCCLLIFPSLKLSKHPPKDESDFNWFWETSSQIIFLFQRKISLNLKIRAASDIGQKKHFFKKSGTRNFTTPYSIPFLSVLQQNKLKLCIAFTKGAEPDCWTHKRSRVGTCNCNAPHPPPNTSPGDTWTQWSVTNFLCTSKITTGKISCSPQSKICYCLLKPQIS